MHLEEVRFELFLGSRNSLVMRGCCQEGKHVTLCSILHCSVVVSFNLKGRIRKGMVDNLLCTGPVSDWPKWPELGPSEAGSQKLLKDLPLHLKPQLSG